MRIMTQQNTCAVMTRTKVNAWNDHGANLHISDLSPAHLSTPPPRLPTSHPPLSHHYHLSRFFLVIDHWNSLTLFQPGHQSIMDWNRLSLPVIQWQIFPHIEASLSIDSSSCSICMDHSGIRYAISIETSCRRGLTHLTINGFQTAQFMQPQRNMQVMRLESNQ